MILILSTPSDPDTDRVIDWINKSESEYFRLNEEDLMSGKVEFYYNPKREQDTYISTFERKIYFNQIKVVWFRKFGFLKSFENEFGKSSDLVRYLYKELMIISKLIYKLLEDKIWLFKKNNMLTKLEVLKKANEIGILIPETIVTTNKSVLSNFFNQEKQLITKSIGDGSLINYKDLVYNFYTSRIEYIDNILEEFSPSLFQKYTEKEYELRIFFIEDSFFAMSIFSQANKKTKYDFRNYDIQNPNRFEPYNLPKMIERKLNILMKNIGLNTGSIDMIKTPEGDYVFLEVNPSGQFGMTAFPCNYPLHKIVANFLIKNSKVSNYDK